MSRTKERSTHARPKLVGLVTALAWPIAACSSSTPTESQNPYGFEEIVYAVRQTVSPEGVPVVADGMGQVMDYGRYVPGGRIEVKNLSTGEVRNILESIPGRTFAKADVEGLDVSFDGARIVFAMKIDGNEPYHIFTANLHRGGDTKNPYGIRQLTTGDNDDLTPIWVAGGKVAFLTNQPYPELGSGSELRADEYNHSRRVTQIATITEEGGDADRKLCSQNLSHTFNLFRMQTGQIGFSRWEHLENVNDSKLFAMNPDCTQMIALAGQHDKPANSLVQVTETLEENVFVAVATDRERTIQAGALVRIDARSSVNDIRHDEERAGFDVLTPGVPRGSDASSIGRYRSPHILPDGRLLVSWADHYVNDVNELSATPPDFGLYIYDPVKLTNLLVHNNKNTWEVFGAPVVPHAAPPVIDSIQNSQDATNPLVIGSINVRNTSLGTVHHNTVGGAQFPENAPVPIGEALNHAVKVRIIEGFSSESAPGVTMFGLTMAEGAAVIGEAPVLADGSWRANVPPFIPFHLQAVDEFELSIRSQTLWMQGMPGEDRVCGGCHEERTGANSPTAQQQPLATTQPSTFMSPIEARTEYPWFMQGGAALPGYTGASEIQKILSEKCATCHNATTNGDQAQEYYTVTSTPEGGGEPITARIARLDLGTTPVTVVYDRRSATYPMSYVSIFYPASMEMGMDMTEVVGTVPPKWGVPSDARHSRLIEKINITSANDANVTAWPLGEAFNDPNIHGASRTMHPEDQQVTLTREERMALIRAFDMGGQYYARTNAATYAANTAAP
jgi:hypothetical protein